MYGSFMNDTINILIYYFYWLNDEEGYAALAEPETNLETHDDIIIEQFQFIYFRKKYKRLMFQKYKKNFSKI